MKRVLQTQPVSFGLSRSETITSLLILLCLFCAGSISRLPAQETLNVEVVGRYDFGTSIDDIILANDLLFVSSYDRIVSMDVSAPGTPRILDTLTWYDSVERDDWCIGMCISNGYLYGLSSSHKLLQIAISNQYELTVSAVYDLPIFRNSMQNMHSNDDDLLIVGPDSLHVYNLHEAGSPSPKSSYQYKTIDVDLVPRGAAIYFDSSYLFIGDWIPAHYVIYSAAITANGTLSIDDTLNLNLSNLGAIAVNDSVFAIGGARPADGYFCELYSMTSSDSLVLRSRIHSRFAFLVSSIVVSDSYLYILSDNGGYFSAYDISDLSAPTLVAQYVAEFPENMFTRMVVQPPYAFIGTLSTGLVVIEMQQTTSVNKALPSAEEASLSIHPNPSSSYSNVRYRLPKLETISLELYNTLGEKVITLYNGPREPGSHSARLDASALPAGTYRVVLRSGEGTQTQMVVVR